MFKFTSPSRHKYLLRNSDIAHEFLNSLLYTQLSDKIHVPTPLA